MSKEIEACATDPEYIKAIEQASIDIGLVDLQEDPTFKIFLVRFN